MKAVVVALYPYNSFGLDYWLDHGAGMTYTATREAGVDVDFLDMKALRNDDELQSGLRGYDLVCFGLKSSYYPIGMRVIKAAKTNGARIMVGGYHATAAPEELIENQDIDWIMKGESEITFPKFLKDPDSFPRFIVGEKPPDLDALPFMDRYMFKKPTEDCGGWWYGSNYKNMVSVMAARGCPFRCAFCQPIENNHFGKKLRRRSVNSLIGELKMLKEKYHPDCVMIHDDTFFVQPKWIEEFIEKYPTVGLPFWAAARADGICKNEDLFRRTVKIGWDLVSVGFESGSQKILDLMLKDTTVEENYESAQIIKSTGAKVYANYILGLPWETQEDVNATTRMVKTINAEMPSWSFFTPYPGCELGDYCIKNGLSLLDRNHYDRCPFGNKVKGVDYDFINRVLKEQRGG
ncbi:MAG: radical SAM protein [Candidatus Izemoplasmatales bacterium]|nr:radical SAM protein [Candidatus Izemoplasmatales bacterium]